MYWAYIWLPFRTGCGESEWGDVGDILGQGRRGAAKVSALNLSRKLDQLFGGSTEMAKFFFNFGLILVPTQMTDVI